MKKSLLIKSIQDWKEYYSDILEHSFVRFTPLTLPSKEIALGLVGIRRCGKTTLAVQLSKQIDEKKVFYYNFEDPLFTSSSTTADIDLLLEAAEEVMDEKPELLILDELHNVELWEKWLRKIVDLKRYRIIVTGSSAKLIKSELSTSLTGRVIAKEIWPLSLIEFSQFNQNLKRKITTIKACKEYITFGGFPAVAKEKNTLQKTEILRSYFYDILYKDVVARNEIRNVKALQDLATYMLTNLSSLHSSVSIQKALGLDKDTAIAYLQYLADAFLINACELYSSNLKIQNRAATKYYLTDLGLHLVGARTGSDDSGKLLENLVYLELRRKNPNIFYYKGIREVDFLTCDSYRPVAAYQVAYSLREEKTNAREVEALVEISNRYELKKLYIITWNEDDSIKINGKKIQVIPIAKLTEMVRA